MNLFFVFFTLIIQNRALVWKRKEMIWPKEEVFVYHSTVGVLKYKKQDVGLT